MRWKAGDKEEAHVVSEWIGGVKLVAVDWGCGQHARLWTTGDPIEIISPKDALWKPLPLGRGGNNALPKVSLDA